MNSRVPATTMRAPTAPALPDDSRAMPALAAGRFRPHGNHMTLPITLAALAGSVIVSNPPTVYS